MAGILGKLKKKDKKLMNESANEITKSIADEETNSPEKLGKQTLEMAQEFATANSDANKISELSDDEKTKTKYFVKVLVQKLIKDENVPDEAVGEFLENLIKNDSQKVGVSVAKEVAPILPDKSIKKIMDLPEVEPKDAQGMVHGISDEGLRNETQKELNLEKLEKLYEKSINLSDNDTLNEVKAIVREKNPSPETRRLVDKIVARRMAADVISVGGFVMKKFSDVDDPVRMLEIDMPNMVSMEYDKISNVVKSKNGKVHTPDENFIREMIIKQIAINVASQYVNMPVNNRSFVIPESEAIKNLSKEEQDYLMKEIISACQINAPKKFEIQDAKNRMNGVTKTDEIETVRADLESIQNQDLKKKTATSIEKIYERVKNFSDEDQEKFWEVMEIASNKVAEKMESLNKNENGNKTETSNQKKDEQTNDDDER